MDAKDLAEAGIYVGDDNESLLRAEAALDFINENTTLTADFYDMESLRKLPAAAKLFITKFGDILARQHGITSESLGGMSQSFGYTDYYDELWDLLDSLLEPWLKKDKNRGLKVFQAKDKWRYGRC